MANSTWAGCVVGWLEEQLGFIEGFFLLLKEQYKEMETDRKKEKKEVEGGKEGKEGEGLVTSFLKSQ